MFDMRPKVLDSVFEARVSFSSQILLNSLSTLAQPTRPLDSPRLFPKCPIKMLFGPIQTLFALVKLLPISIVLAQLPCKVKFYSFYLFL